MEEEEVEDQFHWLLYLIPAVDEIFTATLLSVEPHLYICSSHSGDTVFLAVASAFKNSAQKAWKKPLNCIFSE